MRKFDKSHFFNCATLIPFNDKDEETKNEIPRLKNELHNILQTKIVTGNPDTFRSEIKSPENLKNALKEVLQKVKTNIQRAGKLGKSPIEGSITKPAISAG
jgi:hypothetical protein